VERKKSAEQRAIEKVDSHRARQDIASAMRCVLGERPVCTGIVSGGPGGACDIGEHGGIAEAEVQALRPDGR
jgi:hypothetical protein